MHVTQRGVNRCAIFIDNRDRRHFLDLLGAACRKHDVACHAYALMDNHVHLLLSAPDTGLVSRAMRMVGQSHALAFNLRHERSGTLWQERFKSCLVDSDAYVLQVIRYIELNPVRAALVGSPESYRWSSVHGHLGLVLDPVLSFHHAYESLGVTPADRADAYRQWLLRPIEPEERDRIRRYLAQQRALGDPRFQAMVAKALNRSATPCDRGRPRRVSVA